MRHKELIDQFITASEQLRAAISELYKAKLAEAEADFKLSTARSALLVAAVQDPKLIPGTNETQRSAALNSMLKDEMLAVHECKIRTLEATGVWQLSEILWKTLRGCVGNGLLAEDAQVADLVA